MRGSILKGGLSPWAFASAPTLYCWLIILMFVAEPKIVSYGS